MQSEKGKGKSLELMQKRMQATMAAPASAPASAPAPAPADPVLQPPVAPDTSNLPPPMNAIPVNAPHQHPQVPHVSHQQQQQQQQQHPPYQTKPKGKPDSFAVANANLRRQQNEMQAVVNKAPVNVDFPINAAPAPTIRKKASSVRRTRTPTALEAKMSAPHSSNDSTPLIGQKIRDLLKSIDPAYSLDPEAEQHILRMSEEFVDKLISQSFTMANHRRSQQMNVSDVQLCLSKFWGINIPGLSTTIGQPRTNPLDWALNFNHYHTGQSIVTKNNGSSKRKLPSASGGQTKKSNTGAKPSTIGKGSGGKSSR